MYLCKLIVCGEEVIGEWGYLYLEDNYTLDDYQRLYPHMIHTPMYHEDGTVDDRCLYFIGYNPNRSIHYLVIEDGKIKGSGVLEELECETLTTQRIPPSKSSFRLGSSTFIPKQ